MIISSAMSILVHVGLSELRGAFLMKWFLENRGDAPGLVTLLATGANPLQLFPGMV